MSLEQIKNSNVLLRVDFNVPVRNKNIEDLTRILEAVPTIKLLKDNGNKVAICSHLGRPDLSIPLEENENQVLSFKNYIDQLAEAIGYNVDFIESYPSDEIKSSLEKQDAEHVTLLENTRFYPQEETCEQIFSENLAKYFDVFVFDAFAVAHRKHATTFGVTEYLKSYKGLLVQKEMKGLDLSLNNPKSPMTLIVGGAKIMTKIGVIETFLDKADHICIGGALANTFLYALGYEMGESLVEEEALNIAIKIINKAKISKAELILPIDVKTNKFVDKSVLELKPEDNALDIGVLTTARFENILKRSKSIVFNGPMGVYKKNEFSYGTETVLNTISNTKDCLTILGGGDTLDALRKYAIDPSKFSLVSTGGGAMLKYLEKGHLEVLDKIEN